MRYILILVGILISSITLCQKTVSHNKSLIGEFLKKDGTLAIWTQYSIGEKSYPEQLIVIKRKSDLFLLNIFIDSASYFLTRLGFNWRDTTVVLNMDKIEHLKKLEKKIFSKGIIPTYNCDKNIGKIIHNCTNIVIFYDEDNTVSIESRKHDSNDYSIFNDLLKKSKLKTININGGYVSIRDEIFHLGEEFQKCKSF